MDGDKHPSVETLDVRSLGSRVYPHKRLYQTKDDDDCSVKATVPNPRFQALARDAESQARRPVKQKNKFARTTTTHVGWRQR